jgi:hypothetical protein
MLSLYITKRKQARVHDSVLYNLFPGHAGLSEQNGTGSAVTLAAAFLRAGKPLFPTQKIKNHRTGR